jgi:hypothetical protein
MAILLSLALAGAGLVAPALAANVVSINTTPRQTLTSFGASGAWYDTIDNLGSLF